MQTILHSASPLPHLNLRSPGVISIFPYARQTLLRMHHKLHHSLLLQLDIEYFFLDGDGYFDSLTVRLGPHPDAVHDAAAVSVIQQKGTG